MFATSLFAVPRRRSARPCSRRPAACAVLRCRAVVRLAPRATPCAPEAWSSPPRATSCGAGPPTPIAGVPSRVPVQPREHSLHTPTSFAPSPAHQSQQWRTRGTSVVCYRLVTPLLCRRVDEVYHSLWLRRTLLVASTVGNTPGMQPAVICCCPFQRIGYSARHVGRLRRLPNNLRDPYDMPEPRFCPSQQMVSVRCIEGRYSRAATRILPVRSSPQNNCYDTNHRLRI